MALPRRTMTAKERFYKARGALLYAAREAARLLRFAWVIPCALGAAAVPLVISRTAAYRQGFARLVTFEQLDSAETSYLDAAMSSFALDAAYYDSEGNVITPGGTRSAAITIKEPVSFQTYTVKAGDTISGISQKFGLSNISTLIAVNGIQNVRSLMSGQKLTVPSYDGLMHTVAQGQTLGAIAQQYGTTVEDLLDVNNLSSSELSAGATLFIPGARLDSETLQKAMGELFAYPITASWRLSSKFGYRIDPIKGTASSHTGIDMACPTGTPIHAAMSGTVAYAGFSSVYGYYVIVKHYDGYQTLYAHMSKILAKKGDKVSQGTTLGLVGSTGYSTGPHLHFSVYKNGKLVDPLTVLK